MDRWLLPTRQSDLPGREVIADAPLHARREGSFLALVTIYLIATVALPMFAFGPTIIDLGDALNLDVALPMQIAIGTLLMPIAIVAMQLVCELYGTHRGSVLIVAGAVASTALVAPRAVDAPDTLLASGALIACTTIAQIANVFVFGVSRRAARGHNFVLRTILAAGVSALFGWSAYIVTLGIADELTDLQLATAGAASLYLAAAAIVLALPAMLVRNSLVTYLRTGGYEDELVERFSLETPVDEEEYVEQHGFHAQLHPFTTGEMEFFEEGEMLAEDPVLLQEPVLLR